MAGNGTTVANLLSDPEGQVVTLAEDTLEGASAGDSFAPAAASVSAADYLVWYASAAPRPAEDAAETSGPAPAGDPAPADEIAPAAPAGDPAVGPAGQAPAIGGASLVAGDSHGAAGMVRIAIGDWNDTMPWWGEGGVHKEREGDIQGDGLDQTAPDEYVHGGYSYGYYGDGSYAGDGDYVGDGAYDYSGYYGYSMSSAGDINGDGFEDWLYEGYGYSYVMYGYDGNGYSYAGDGFNGEGDAGYDYAYGGYAYYYSYAVGDVNGDGFEDYVVGTYGYAYTVYGYADMSQQGGGDGAASYGEGVYSGDGVYVIYTAALGHIENISIQATGDAEVLWTNDRIVVTAGDGSVVISIDDDVMTFGDAAPLAELSLPGAKVTLMGAGLAGTDLVLLADG